MINRPRKQRGLSLLETILAVVLVGGAIAVLMHIETGGKVNDNTTALGQHLSILLNKTLEKTETDPDDGTGSLASTGELIKNIDGIAEYLGIQQNFVDSLTAQGLKTYDLKISIGTKDSGQTNYPASYSGGCNYLMVYITNNSSYSWAYDQALSEEYTTGKGHLESSTPINVTTTPIAPGDTVSILFASGAIRQYLYFRSTIGDHVIGYFLYKENKNDNVDPGGQDLDVDTRVQQGLNFTRHGAKDANGHCDGGIFDNEPEKYGKAFFVMFDPAPQTVLIDTELSSVKQAKIVSSKTYGVIDDQHLAKLQLITSKPVDMTLNNKKINYTFNQVCQEGELDHTDNHGVLQETPSICAYDDKDDSVVDKNGNPVHV